MSPAKTGKKQGDSRFKQGQSGNPKGRPAGSRNKASLAVEALLDGEAEALTHKAVELALEGDVTALRLCLERLCPPRKDRPIPGNAVKLPPLKTSNLNKASAVIIRAVAGGRLTPAEGEALSRMLEAHRKAIALVDIEERLARLEQSNGG